MLSIIYKPSTVAFNVHSLHHTYEALRVHYAAEFDIPCASLLLNNNADADAQCDEGNGIYRALTPEGPTTQKLHQPV